MHALHSICYGKLNSLHQRNLILISDDCLKLLISTYVWYDAFYFIHIDLRLFTIVSITFRNVFWKMFSLKFNSSEWLYRTVIGMRLLLKYIQSTDKRSLLNSRSYIFLISTFISFIHDDATKRYQDVFRTH